MTIGLVNARGIPGALGVFVDERRFLTCHHVLFGGGASAGDPIWCLDDTRWPPRRIPFGRTLRGFRGLVTYRGAACFIDAALGETDEDRSPQTVALADPTIGMRVWKRGPVTGETHGIVADDRHFERPEIAGTIEHAIHQLRISPRDRDTQFSAAGESGAAVLDETGRFAGLIWGCTTYGEAIACPAAAVFAALGL